MIGIKKKRSLKFQVGESVQWAKGFLTANGIPPTSDMWRMWGVVKKVELHNGASFCVVQWEGENPPLWVLEENLTRAAEGG
jgi:hypothetical protein